DSGDTASFLISKQTVESNFLDFPLLLKYKSRRVNNYRPYLIGGLNMRYDMAARKDYDSDGPYVRLTPMDFYAEFGFGIDFFLQYFKFSPELKVSVGFRDVLVHDPAGGGNSKYAKSINKLNSYVVMLCFYFE
ncbi:MAG: outer membrane beta-barrel protein, partial [Bacteroidales bacterium]